MNIIAGLGNPGPQYDNTRHNVGFMFLDYLAAVSDANFSESKWQASVARALVAGKSAVLVKPLTFMNRSGRAVAPVARYYKVEPGSTLIVHDDLDMDFGRIKMVAGGGDGGHKGVRSIIESLGTRDFPRLKIGIGRPPEPIPPEKYVLGRMDAGELNDIAMKMKEMAAGINILLTEGMAAAMNRINRKV